MGLPLFGWLQRESLKGLKGRLKGRLEGLEEELKGGLKGT